MVSLVDRKGGCGAKEAAASKKDDKIPHITRIEIYQADQELQPRNFTVSLPWRLLWCVKDPISTKKMTIKVMYS
jgi:hypothetical protein